LVKNAISGLQVKPVEVGKKVKIVTRPNWKMIPVVVAAFDVICFSKGVKFGICGGAFDSAKNHKSVTAKREKSQTPKFV